MLYMFDKIFGPLDKMGYIGFMAMWFSFFFVSFGVMLGDSTTGPLRDFCAVSQLLCCSNLVMVWPMVFHGLRLPC